MFFRRFLKSNAADRESRTLHPSVRGPGHATILAEAESLNAQGRHGAALERIDRALAEAPDDPELIDARGRTLYAWGRFIEAREQFRQAVDHGRCDDGLFRKLGWVSLWSGDPVAGEAWMRKALELDPSAWANHFGLGAMLHVQREFKQAIASQRCALEVSPDNLDSLNSAVVCQLDIDDPIGAERDARRVTAIDPNNPLGWANLGVALAKQDRFDQAREPFERAMRLEEETGELVDSFANYCNYLRDTARNGDALVVLEAMLPRRPSLLAHGDYAFTLLTAGRLREGWKEYEFRWMKEPFISMRPGFEQPPWTGQDVRGKTVLVRVEQGFGDSIQFVRYLPHLKALGATVLLMLRPGLERILATASGYDRILDRNEPIPPFDYYVHMMSLPRLFGTEVDTIPADVPYLRADPDLLARWQERLGTSCPRVGIAWAGNAAHPNDRFRSIALRLLAPILQTPGIQFVSLQKGPQAAEADAVTPYVNLLNLGPDLEDFADTAAVIEQLDLVICVDTSVAHIAGALGKPVWMLVPLPADFRWLERRTDSPWYPSMRLFRQTRRGHWEDVLPEVSRAFNQWLAEGRRAGTAVQASKSATALQPVPELALLPDSGSGRSTVAETRHGVLQFYPDEPLVGRSLAFYGEYEQPLLDVLQSLVLPGSTILEVGSGVGDHVLALSTMVGPDGHVLAAEWRPLFHRVLGNNLVSNKRVNVTRLWRRLGRPGERDADEKPFKPVSYDAGRVPEPDGRVETLDELRLARLDWLKVRTGELAQNVLEGGRESIWRLRPRLVLAANDPESIRELAQQTREFGYRCWHLEASVFSAANFNCRTIDILPGSLIHALIAIPEELDDSLSLQGCHELA